MPTKKKKTKSRKKKYLPAPKSGHSKKSKRKTKIARTPKTLKAKAAPRVIGVVTHYFPHVDAAVVKLKKPLKVNEAIAIKGHTTDFLQTVASMQIDHKAIQRAAKGKEIGLQVKERVREGDLILEDKKSLTKKG